MSGRRTRLTTRSSVEPDVQAPTRRTRQNARRNAATTEGKNTSQSQPSLRMATRSGASALHSDPVGASSSRETAQQGKEYQHRRRSGSGLEAPGNEASLGFHGEAERELQEAIEEDAAEESPEAPPTNRLPPAAEPARPEDAESAAEKEARMHAFGQVAVPKFMALCAEIHSMLQSMKDGVPSVQDKMNLECTLLPYNALRNAFSDKGMHYVQFDESHLGSISSDDPQLRDNARRAICSANLVTLLMEILDIKQSKKNALPLLQELDGSAFSTLHNPQDEAKGICNLALRVRCRCLVDALATASDRQPIQTLASLFCDDTNASPASARQILESGSYKQLAGININEHEWLAAAYEDILDDFKSNMSELVDYVDEFCSTEEELMDDLKDWALEKLGRLTGDPAVSNSQRSQRTQQGSEAPDSDSESEPEAIHVPALKGPSGSLLDGSVTLADVRRGLEQPTRGPSTASPSKQPAAKGKEKASELPGSSPVLDSLGQQDSPRPSPSPNSRIASRLRPAETPRGSTKRPADTGGDDDEEDDFEVNDRLNRVSPIDPIERDSSGAFPKRPRVSRPPASSRQPMPEQRRRPPSSMSGGEGVQEYDFVSLTQAARNLRREFNYGKARQVRAKWTNEESRHLIDLIAEHRCSWAEIANNGQFENDRNQQAVRDRARNLKVHFLSSDLPLPACFDLVRLGPKEQETVRRAGRNPYREENDLDEEGNVINNLLVE